MTTISFGLFGAGGFGREVMPYSRECVARQLGVSLDAVQVYFVETTDSDVCSVNGHQVISFETFIALEGSRYFNIAIADGKVRRNIAESAEKFAKPLLIQAQTATVLDHSRFGEGAILCGHSTITANATIGRYFHANLYSYVAHDCVIGDFVTFAPGVCCNGRVHVEDHAYIGTNAVIKEGLFGRPLRIGVGAVVGMGAVVTKDVPDGVTVIGNPARIMPGGR